MKLEAKYLTLALRISAIILGIVGGFFLYRSTEKSYHILMDGSELNVRTHASRVGAILERAGIQISSGDDVFPGLDHELEDGEMIEIRSGQPLLLISGNEFVEVSAVGGSIGDIIADLDLTLLPGDRVWVDGLPLVDVAQTFAPPPRLIALQKSESILLEIDGGESELRTSAPTLGEALAEAGITLHFGDELVPGPEAPTDGLAKATLRRANAITIFADDAVIHTRVVADTVGEALTSAGLSLIGLDYAIPSIQKSLPGNGEIRVVRVREEVIIEQAPIPFQTTYEPNPEFEIDQQSIIESGSYGVLASRIRVAFEDGEEISRTVEGEWVAREPEHRKIGYGTNIVIRSIDTPDGPINYWRAIRMYATSYSPSRAGVPDDWPWFGITACGKELVKGLVAIDNRYIPFYTMMYVPGYGYAEACDIGGGVKGRWIDLGYEDHNWKNWHENVTVYFLTPVPPANSISWIFP